MNTDTTNDKVTEWQTATDLSTKSSNETLQPTTKSTSYLPTTKHPIIMLSPMPTIMNSKQLVSKFQLKKYETPINGNCGIQGIMDHLNIEKEINIDIYNLENVALFRRYLYVEIVTMLLDDKIKSKGFEKDFQILSLSSEYILDTSVYFLDNHERYKTIGKLDKELWLDHKIVLPLIAFVLKKSI